jgi:hypothetical protein
MTIANLITFTVFYFSENRTAISNLCGIFLVFSDLSRTMSLLYETDLAVLPFLDATAGLVSGIAGVTVSQPFDTVRVRSQVLQKPVLQTIYGTVEAGTAVGLYRGVVPALCATTMVSTTVFTSLEFAKRALSSVRGNPSTVRAPLIDTFLGGSFSGMVVSTLTAPLHRVKVQLQAGVPAKSAGGHTISAAVQCARSVLKHEGVRGLYLGWRTQLLSETLGRGVYFGTYDTCKRFFWKNSVHVEPHKRYNNSSGTSVVPSYRSIDDIPLYGRIFSGAVSGVVGWTAIYPIDVIKNQIQAQTVSAKTKSRWRQVVQRLYLQGGIAAFYRGWSVVVVRALPVSSIALPTYDLVHMSLQNRIEAT